MEQNDSQDERSLSDEMRYDSTDQKQFNNQKNYEQKNTIDTSSTPTQKTQIQKINPTVHKTKQSGDLVAQTSLEKITVQSPLRNPHAQIQQKKTEKSSYSLKKNQDKYHQRDTLKNNKFLNDNSSPKNIHEPNMKQTRKSNQKLKKGSKPFYQETFYITGMKENYLLLLSDNNQVLEFPVGMFTTKGGSNQERQQSEDDSGEGKDQFQIMKDIKIGQPIKIKLELDIFRQEKDERMFNSLQRRIQNEYGINQANRQVNVKKRN